MNFHVSKLGAFTIVMGAFFVAQIFRGCGHQPEPNWSKMQQLIPDSANRVIDLSGASDEERKEAFQAILGNIDLTDQDKQDLPNWAAADSIAGKSNRWSDKWLEIAGRDKP